MPACAPAKSLLTLADHPFKTAGHVLDILPQRSSTASPNLDVFAFACRKGLQGVKLSIQDQPGIRNSRGKMIFEMDSPAIWVWFDRDRQRALSLLQPVAHVKLVYPNRHGNIRDEIVATLFDHGFAALLARAKV